MQSKAAEDVQRVGIYLTVHWVVDEARPEG